MKGLGNEHKMGMVKSQQIKIASGMERMSHQ